MASSNANSNPNTQNEEFRNGDTIMKEVLRAKSKGIKFEVRWNKKGQPIGPNGSKLVNYIGAVVRKMVPITYDNWNDSALDVFKKDIWLDIQMSFIVDESHKIYVLKEAGKLHREFRAYLTKHCLRDAVGNVNEHPPTKHAHIISEDVWKAFIAKRIEDNSFQLQVTESESLSIPRERLWKAARVDKAGVVENEIIQQVLDHCETLSQPLSEGEIKDRDHQDILGKALNAPEYPGRVRGVGFGVSQRDYFPPRKRPKQKDVSEIQRLREIVEQLTRHVNNLENKLEQKEAEGLPDVASSSTKDSCTPACNVSEIPTKSKGKGEESRHTKDLITSATKKDGKLALQPFPAGKIPLYCTYLDVYVQKSMRDDHQLHMNMSQSLFGVQYDEMIGGEQIHDFLRHRQLGASVICIYIRYLYEHLISPRYMNSMFAFLSPHRISTFATEQSQYVADALLALPSISKLYLAPYNTGTHWVLIVLNPTVKVAYFLNPMCGDPRNYQDMKDMFNRGLQIYCTNRKVILAVSKSSKVKWIQIECPGQTSHIDCDYYVMRFMKEIILKSARAIPETYFPDYKCLSYSHDQLCEVKEEWSRYVVENFC